MGSGLRGAEDCLLSKHLPGELWAMADSSWADVKPARKSTLSYMLFINNVVFSWRSSLASSLSLSTAEAELIAVMACVTEINFMYKTDMSKPSLIQLLFDVPFADCESLRVGHTRIYSACKGMKAGQQVPTTGADSYRCAKWQISSHCNVSNRVQGQAKDTTQWMGR